jgi:hypothetical protein
MESSAVWSAVRQLELWDGALDALAPLVHALEALTTELADARHGPAARAEAAASAEPATRPAPLASETAAAWMRLDAVLLAALGRVELTSVEGRHYARRLQHLREVVRTRGPLARPRRLT